MATILNLPHWAVSKVTEPPGQYVVEATYTVAPDHCPHCGSVGGVGKHGSKAQEVIDLPSHGRTVRVTLTRTRHRCKDCGRTFLQPVPEVAESGSMTKRCVAYIERQSIKHTFAHVAGEVGVDEKTVRNLFNSYTDWLDKTVVFETPRVLGLDEVFLLGHARCVAVNVEESTIVGVLEDRNKPTLHDYLFWLKDRERVQVVTQDMWKPYRDAVKAVLPGAVVVIDKFHVVRMATKALETVRRGLRDTMTATKRREVMRSRFLLLRRAWQLSDEQKAKVEEWTATLPTLGAAYRLKEGFYGVFDQKTRAAAEAAYDLWLEGLPTDMRGAFKETTTAMTNWRKEVFNYFDHQYTNAVTESLNGLTKIINRNGRGYSFRAVRAKMLFNKYVQWTHQRKVEAENETDGLLMKPGEIDARDERLDHLIERGDPIPVRNYGPLIDHLDSVLMMEEDREDSQPDPTPPSPQRPKRK